MQGCRKSHTLSPQVRWGEDCARRVQNWVLGDPWRDRWKARDCWARAVLLLVLWGGKCYGVLGFIVLQTASFLGRVDTKKPPSRRLFRLCCWSAQAWSFRLDAVVEGDHLFTDPLVQSSEPGL